MADKATLSEQKARGEEARLLAEHPLLNKAFENINADLHRIWAESHTDEADKRHNAYLMQKLLGQLKEQFTKWIVEGQAADRALSEIDQPSKIRRMINAR